jgi:catechol 2,3-dioxygenase-like lactoylglutathione lyase family enzyme
MAKYSSTVIFVENIEASKNFYQKIFDLEIEFDFGENVMFKDAFAIWQIDNANKHIFDDSVICHNKCGIELYFEEEQFDEFYDKLTTHNIQLIHHKKTEDWGQHTIRFYDPDNNIIEVAEKMTSVIRRLNNEGLSPKEISTKTQHPLDFIQNIINAE